ncbi:MAG: hypothetical protein LBH78_03445 [Rickettsiales bacterium]|jgi:hypothetical protein|nr:hypothetical protein [Rickettsiales bacterium]
MIEILEGKYKMSVKQHKSKKTKGYESISRDFLQRNDLSLEARGLIAYMQSMPENYIFHKTQLYKCFDKNRKTSIERIWNELLDAQFIISFSKGSGPRQKFDYIFSQEGFSKDEIQEINEEYLAEGWEIAYRSGTNRKPASYYQERKKSKKISEIEAELKVSKPSNNQGVETQHPDKKADSLGVGFQQLKTNSSKPTDIKLSTKGLLKKEEDDENNNKENFNFENQNWKNAVETEKVKLHEKYGAVASALIKNAELFTEEHLVDMSHYWDYLYKALQNEEQRHIKFSLRSQQEPDFYIPLDGPWNSERM